MAICVGQMGWTPCSPCQAARRGSRTRAITFDTPNRSWAICETTRLVLSPLVEAMNTSASSIPASVRASISSAVPIVKRPPASSQLWPSSTSRRSWESGSSSRTETVWPARRAAVATEDPTLPAPITSTNTARTLAPWRLGRWRIGDAAGLVGREARQAHRIGGARRAGALEPAGTHVAGAAVAGRRGEDDAAGGLVDDVARGLAHERVVEPALAAQQRAAAHAGGLLRREDDRLDPPPLGLAHDALPRPAGAHGGGGDLHALVLLPHRLRTAERLAGALELLVADARVQRQRHRHLEHPHRLDHRAALALVGVLLHREAAGGLHDVVVERGAEHRDEDRAVLGRRVPPARQRALGDRHALEDRLALRDAVEDVQADTERDPAEPGPAGAGVEDHYRYERACREQRAERGGQRQLAAADPHVQRRLEGPVAVGL